MKRSNRTIEGILLILASAILLMGFALCSMAKYSAMRYAGASMRGTWICVLLFLCGFGLLHAIMRKSAPKADPYILPCVMMLAGLGALSIFSIKTPIGDSSAFPRQIVGVLFGIVAAIIPFTVRFRSLRLHRYRYVYAIAAVGLMILLFIFGRGPANTKLSLLGFQPIEAIKLLLVFFAASYLSERWDILMDKTGPKRLFGLPRFGDVGPLAVMYFASLALFLLVKDLGPMPILFGTFLGMLYAATGKRTFVWLGVGLMLVTGLMAYRLGVGVFPVRVDMWLHPWMNSHPSGMQLGEGLWGMATGGIWGSGPGLGSPSLIPVASSDLIFAAIGEEFGLIGSLGVLLLWGVLLARGFRIALRARTDFQRFLGIGIASLLGIQTVIIVFGVLGLAPLTGVTLPFTSLGGSSIIISFFMIGLLLWISSEGERDSSQVRIETRRAVQWLSTVLLVLLLGVAGIGRLVWIQGIAADQVAGRPITTPDSDGYYRPHVNPRLRQIVSEIPRGSIYDRTGRILATSKASELSELGLLRAASSRPQDRYYPYGRSLVHLVGLVDPRCGGPIGLENSEDSTLRGFNAYSDLLPVYRRQYLPFKPHLQGKDIRLSIDVGLQKGVEKALREKAGAVRDRRTGVRKHKAAAVVIDVRTGEILAAVSLPNYDPNELSPDAWKLYNTDRTKESVLFDRSRHSAYTPGSVFKLVTASAALASGANTVYNCTHEEHNVIWRYNGRTYSRGHITDLEEMRAHGRTDLEKAIRVSCNLYFAHLGLKIGPNKLYDMASRYRLRRIPSPQKLAEDLPDNSYGQGTVQVSPLEMARVAATIGNGGVMLRPHLVKEIDLGGKILRRISPEEMGRPIGPKSAAYLRAAMADAAKNGTGKGLFTGVGVSVAGKTGSAENDQADKMPHSWFVGFAPVDHPKIAFAVIVENGGYGRSVAGPVCREIVKAAFK